jgi:hypothetical protein
MSWQYNQYNGTWVKELFAFRNFGASIVALPPTSSIPSTELETEGEYHDFSVWLKRPKLGGHLSLKLLGRKYSRPGRCVYWRPDLESAEVSTVLSGTGYLFNFGWKTNTRMPKAQFAL